MAIRLIARVGLCALIVAPLLAGTSFGQERGRGGRGGPGGFGGFGGPGGFQGGGGGGLLGLAGRPEVQEALGFTADEKDYVRLIAEGMRDSAREAMQNQEGDFRERMQRMREFFAKQAKETEEQLTEAIGQDKVKRLKEIEIQLMGFRALMDRESEVAKAVELSDEQREKLGDAVQEVEEELQEIRRKKVEEKLMGIFSSSQKSKWEELTGKPIDFKLRPVRRERRDGEGGGRRGRPGADPGT